MDIPSVAPVDDEDEVEIVGLTSEAASEFRVDDKDKEELSRGVGVGETGACDVSADEVDVEVFVALEFEVVEAVESEDEGAGVVAGVPGEDGAVVGHGVEVLVVMGFFHVNG